MDVNIPGGNDVDSAFLGLSVGDQGEFDVLNRIIHLFREEEEVFYADFIVQEVCASGLFNGCGKTALGEVGRGVSVNQKDLLPVFLCQDACNIERTGRLSGTALGCKNPYSFQSVLPSAVSFSQVSRIESNFWLSPCSR